MTGLVADVQEGKASSSRSKGILFVMVGFVIWTAVSKTSSRKQPLLTRS
jgi:nitrate reductase NapE component